MQAKNKLSLRMIVYIGVLVALYVVLGHALPLIAMSTTKYSFGFVAICVAAMLFGIWPAALVGGLGDLIGALCFPIGPYFPGFTASAIITGIFAGLLLGKNRTKLKSLLYVAIAQIAIGLFLNTFWLTLCTGEVTFVGLIVSRLPQCIIMGVVEYVLILLLEKPVGLIKKTIK